MRGINGGGMFFLTLPNTQIEIDIPIFQYLPTDIATDKLNTISNHGLMPDVMIEARASDIQRQTDGVLNRLIQTISEDDAN